MPGRGERRKFYKTARPTAPRATVCYVFFLLVPVVLRDGIRVGECSEDGLTVVVIVDACCHGGTIFTS